MTITLAGVGRVTQFLASGSGPVMASVVTKENINRIAMLLEADADRATDEALALCKGDERAARKLFTAVSQELTHSRSVQGRAQAYVAHAKARWGGAWAHLSQEQRAGAVALQVVQMLTKGEDPAILAEAAELAIGTAAALNM